MLFSSTLKMTQFSVKKKATQEKQFDHAQTDRQTEI